MFGKKRSFMYCYLLSSGCFERRMDPADLASLRLCEKPDCVYAVTNGLKDVKDILHSISNHIAAIHPSWNLKAEKGLVNLRPAF